MVFGMSTVAEIEHALEKLPPEQWLEVRHWMDRHAPRLAPAVSQAHPLPDFLARQKALFGGRVLEDSQHMLDELRTDRR